MVLPTAIRIGLPEKLNREIGELMDMIDVNDVEALMNTPVPPAMKMAWWKGFQRIYDASKV